MRVPRVSRAIQRLRSGCGLVTTNALVLTGLATFRVVGHPEVMQSLTQDRQHDFQVRRNLEESCCPVGGSTAAGFFFEVRDSG
jgi:hypothetical protein